MEGRPRSDLINLMHFRKTTLAAGQKQEAVTIIQLKVDDSERGSNQEMLKRQMTVFRDWMWGAERESRNRQQVSGVAPD